MWFVPIDRTRPILGGFAPLGLRVHQQFGLAKDVKLGKEL